MNAEELRALADAADADASGDTHAWLTARKNLWGMAPSLARDHAALLDRIRDAAEAEEHLKARARSWQAVIHGHAASLLRGLLAEMQERPS